MKHRNQHALRDGRWKYLKVDEHEYLFDIETDARERANRAKREPQRLAEIETAVEAGAAHAAHGAAAEYDLMALGIA